MQVNLDNSKEYDKVIIYINSINGIFQNTTDFKFYININEPIKNIACIKLMNIQVITNTAYTHDDIFYIELNNYDRVVSYIKNANDEFNVIKYFENVQYTGELLLPSSKKSSRVSYNSSSIDWSDPSVYLLNPPEPTLHRFDITLRDKDYNIINRNNIDTLKMSICLYYINKNVLYK